ncbi:zinc metallochaperone AztD [Arthrobacter sp. Z1-15]
MTLSAPSLRRAAALSVAALLLAGCGTGQTPAAPDPSPAAASAGSPDASGHESPEASPRLVTTYDGGVQVLDGETLQVLADFEMSGFNRINPAGDGRHVIISTADAFKVLDTGTWTDDDGTHRTSDPVLTGLEFDTSKPGHVVHHAGRTVLFSDGTGAVESFETADLAGLARGEKPDTETHTAAEAHHGVAVELSNGELVLTLGNDEERPGITVLDSNRGEIVRNEDCPGVHGEATAAGEAVVIGCETGVLVYDDGAITKIDSPDAYGRIGNQAGSEESPVTLGDYKSDPDAELERPERISLINTATKQLQLVDLGTSYSFRSLARGPHGEALVLGTDGALHTIDPETGELVSSTAVVEPWEEPLEWQQPRPTLTVVDHTAYVTDPSANTVIAVDIESGTVTGSGKLEQTPNELTGAAGQLHSHS